MCKRYIPQCLFLLVLFLCNSGTTAGAQQFVHYNSGEPSFKNGGPIQLGVKVAYLMPRNEFGMDFNRAPGYEFYCQFRDDGGAGRWAARLGVFYANFKPRLDTVPSYMVQEFPTMIFPGYIVYRKLSFIGLTMDYAYSVVHQKGFRLDLGLGLIIGQYHQEYEQGYATIITTSGSQDVRFCGLRPRITAGYQLNRFIELYVECMDAFLTNTDWSSQFHHTGLGLGLNIALKPGSNDQ